MKVHSSTSSIYSSLYQSQSSTDSDENTPFTLPGDDSDEQTTGASTTTSSASSSIANSISSAFWTSQTTSTDTSSTTSTSPAADSTDTSSTEDTSAADLLSEFAKLANMTPAEKIRDQYLKQHNLTEEQFSQLSPDEQKAINDQIAAQIKQQLGAGKKDGSDAENETASALSIA